MCSGGDLYKYLTLQGFGMDHNLTSITHITEHLTSCELTSLITVNTINTTKLDLSTSWPDPNLPHLLRLLSIPYPFMDTMHTYNFLQVQQHHHGAFVNNLGRTFFYNFHIWCLPCSCIHILLSVANMREHFPIWRTQAEEVRRILRRICVPPWMNYVIIIKLQRTTS